ncbi:MAG: aa3-type cytochrome c oxidase subunit IV [Rhodobacteraceae bacterium]|nr:MAG: aa3-type cytochrome c oxidase subunit IV [Paracoccaceae bacterium]
MSEKKHKHGEMDITDQKESFARFISFGLYLCYAVTGALVFLALFNS